MTTVIIPSLSTDTMSGQNGETKMSPNFIFTMLVVLSLIMVGFILWSGGSVFLSAARMIVIILAAILAILAILDQFRG